MFHTDPAMITGFFIAAALSGGAWALAWRQEVAAMKRAAPQVAAQPAREPAFDTAMTVPQRTLQSESCGMMVRAA